MSPEGKVKKAISDYLRSIGIKRAGDGKHQGAVTGWYYMPVPNGMGVNGIPDFCGIYRGRPFYIEAKAVGGKPPTANQIARHQEIQDAGGFVVVCNDVTQLCDVIKQIDEVVNG